MLRHNHDLFAGMWFGPSVDWYSYLKVSSETER